MQITCPLKISNYNLSRGKSACSFFTRAHTQRARNTRTLKTVQMQQKVKFCHRSICFWLRLGPRLVTGLEKCFSPRTRIDFLGHSGQKRTKSVHAGSVWTITSLRSYLSQIAKENYEICPRCKMSQNGFWSTRGRLFLAASTQKAIVSCPT